MAGNLGFARRKDRPPADKAEIKVPGRSPDDVPAAPRGAMARPNGINAKKIGRRERIRTSGPYVPNVVLYQAELLSEPVRKGEPLPSGGALITMPPCPRNRPCSRMQRLVRPAILGVCGPYLRVGPPGLIRVRAGGDRPLPLGRRQAVRHWILIPAFEGSIPSAPATQSLLCRGCAKHGISSRTSGPLALRLFRRSIKGGSQARETGRLWCPVSGPRKSISAFVAVT